MKAYKGFNSDMTCRGFQYENGKDYETENADLCHNGFHACENPLDCLGYYHPANGGVFHEVELDEVSTQRGNDSKICGKRIKIGARISIDKLIKGGIDFIFSKVDQETGNIDNSTSASSGNNSTSASSGNGSKSSVKGKNTVACAIGKDTRVKGDIDSWIIATEYGEWDDQNQGYPVLCVKAEKIDWKNLLPDVWYTVKNGEFVKVK